MLAASLRRMRRSPPLTHWRLDARGPHRRLWKCTALVDLDGAIRRGRPGSTTRASGRTSGSRRRSARSRPAPGSGRGTSCRRAGFPRTSVRRMSRTSSPRTASTRPSNLRARFWMDMCPEAGDRGGARRDRQLGRLGVRHHARRDDLHEWVVGAGHLGCADSRAWVVARHAEAGAELQRVLLRRDLPAARARHRACRRCPSRRSSSPSRRRRCSTTRWRPTCHR